MCSSSGINVNSITGDENIKKTVKRITSRPKTEKAITARSEKRYLLKLFVAGATARSRQALRRVHELCEAKAGNKYELEVVDVYQQPNLAREHQIVATPTLLRLRPDPMRRFIGNLSQTIDLFDDSDMGFPVVFKPFT